MSRTGLKFSKHSGQASCYDLSPKQGRFAGNVCQNSSLAIWATVGNVHAH